MVILLLKFDTQVTKRELDPKCVPQLLLGSSLGARRSAIGQFFSMSPVTVPEILAEVSSPQFFSRYLSGGLNRFALIHKQIELLFSRNILKKLISTDCHPLKDIIPVQKTYVHNLRKKAAHARKLIQSVL